MEKVVDTINSLLQRTRRSYNDYKSRVSQEKGEIKDIKDSFKRLHSTSDLAKNLQNESYQLTPQLANVASSVRNVLKRVENIKPLSAEDASQRTLLKEIDDSLQKAMSILIKVDNILAVAQKLEHDAKFIQPKVEDLQDQLGEFAELAGLGLTAEALSHEISNIVDRLLEQTNNIGKKLKGKSSIDTSPVFVYVEYVKSSIQAFRKQLSHLAPSLRYVREKKEDINMENYVKEVATFYSEKYRGLISIDVQTIGKNFKISMSRGKLTQIFDNIILNSEYWLKSKKRDNKNFKPQITIEIEKPFLRIFDNGPGIAKSYERRVFQPFVTSKPRDVGRGLGLFIVQQLLDTVGGEIMLLDERNKEGRQYKFQINLASIIS